jgi:hypothetical protein
VPGTASARGVPATSASTSDTEIATPRGPSAVPPAQGASVLTSLPPTLAAAARTPRHATSAASDAGIAPAIPPDLAATTDAAVALPVAPSRRDLADASYGDLLPILNMRH